MLCLHSSESLCAAILRAAALKLPDRHRTLDGWHVPQISEADRVVLDASCRAEQLALMEWLACGVEANPATSVWRRSVEGCVVWRSKSRLESRYKDAGCPGDHAQGIKTIVRPSHLSYILNSRATIWCC